MLEHKNSRDRNASLYKYFIQKDQEAYKKMYKLIQLIVKAKTVAKFATNTELVLKDEGVLIVPTLTYSKNSFLGKVRAFFRRLTGFHLYKEYLNFLWQNAWTVLKSTTLKASFPLTYTKCAKSEV